ncbi:MAG: sulfatase [Candidatus Binatia bacterium]
MVAVAGEVLETLQNGYVGAGLLHLIPMGVRETFAALWILTLLVAMGTRILRSSLSRMGRASVRGFLVVAAAVLAVGALYLVNLLADPDGSALQRLLWSQRLTLRRQPPFLWLSAAALALLLSLLPERPRDRGRFRGAFAVALVLVLAATFAVTETRRRSIAGGERKNVVVVVLDTMAATHMASYGYGRVTTPNLDRLTRRGLFFRSSHSVAPWTLPSHASMFTGLYPIAHGATQEHLRLDRRFVTAAELLKDRGYRTFAAVNNGVIYSPSGLAQGFSTYLEMLRRDEARTYRGRGRHPTNAAVEEFLDSLDEDDRFFIFLNYIEPHAPYEPPRATAERFLRNGWTWEHARKVPHEWWRYYTGEIAPSPAEITVLNDLYDAELADLDETVDDLVEMFERRGLLDDTLVILTADHGENIGDHGHFDHVFTVYESVLRVPLILIGAGVRGGVERTDPATSADVFHTIVSAAGLRSEQRRAHGRDLRAEPVPPWTDAAVIAEYYYPLQVLSVVAEKCDDCMDRVGRLASYLRRLRSIESGGRKLIWASDGRHALYHLSDDPGERNDLAASEPGRVAELERRLFDRLSALKGERVEPGSEALPGPEDTKGFQGIDAETLEQLKGLGYVGGP